jgi:hypothetical protein
LLTIVLFNAELPLVATSSSLGNTAGRKLRAGHHSLRVRGLISTTVEHQAVIWRRSLTQRMSVLAESQLVVPTCFVGLPLKLFKIDGLPGVGAVLEDLKLGLIGKLLLSSRCLWMNYYNHQS